LQKRNLIYKDLENNDKLMDSLLIEATINAHKPIRVPGKYKYDTSKGEQSLEQFEEMIKEDINHRF